MNKILSTKILTRGVMLVSAAVIIGFVGLVLSGHATVTWGKSKDKVASANGGVCGDDIVTTYNSVARFEKRSDSADYTIDEKGLRNLVADIKSKSGYQDDPTCQTILLLTAIHDEAYNDAKAAYQTLQTLHDKHLYANSNLNGGGSLSTYESLVRDLAPPSQDDSTQGAQGGA